MFGSFVSLTLIMFEVLRDSLNNHFSSGNIIIVNTCKLMLMYAQRRTCILKRNPWLTVSSICLIASKCCKYRGNINSEKYKRAFIYLIVGISQMYGMFLRCFFSFSRYQMGRTGRNHSLYESAQSISHFGLASHMTEIECEISAQTFMSADLH